MPLSIHVQDANGEPVRESGRIVQLFQDDGVNLERMLRECQNNDSFHFLPFIDFYDDTVFNRLQMTPFLAEWRRIRPTNDQERGILVKVERLADMVATEVHLDLKFLGD